MIPAYRKTRKLTQTIRDVAETRREIMNATSKIPDQTTDLKQLIGKEDQTSLGNKLIKTGTLLAIAVPEPVITDIAGVALIATGYTMNKLKPATICDIYTNINQALNDTAQLKKELNNLTLQ